MRRIVPGRRKPRPLLGVSGMVLFICMFLPALRGCESTMTPLDAPPFLPPYVYGLVLAIAALWRTPRGMAFVAVALRVVSALVVIGSIAVTVLAPPVGMGELLLGSALLALIGLHDASERRVAVVSLAIGTLCTLWFSFWAVAPDALVGVHLSLVASIGVLAGSLAWLHELVARRRIEMPRAAIVL